MSILINWLLSALTILLTSQIVPGFKVDTFTTALIVAFALGIVNAVIKPILIILTLPINILTLGLFTFVINAGLILLVDRFVPGFQVEGFTPALIAALVLWIISVAINILVFPVKAI